MGRRSDAAKASCADAETACAALAGKNLNRVIAQAAAQGAPYNFLAAPAGGYVLHAQETDLMLLATVLASKTPPKPETLAHVLVQQLLALGKGLKDGEQPLSSAEAMTPKAQQLAQTFLSQTLPAWKQLGVVA